jgi:hypothetical protein
VTGCGSGDTSLNAESLSSPQAAEPTEFSPPSAQAVVAVTTSFVDAFNPYHSFFRRGGALYGDREPSGVTADVLRQFDIGPDQVLNLTVTGNPDADVAADAAVWAQIEPQRFYWFSGTNVLLFQHSPDAPVMPGRDDPLPPGGSEILPVPLPATGIPFSEATLSAASVLKANPDAVVVVIAAITSTPLFDVIRQVQPIDMGAVFFDAAAVPAGVEASAPAVIEKGKLLFAPTFQSGIGIDAPLVHVSSIPHGHSGPWWMISVGSYEEGFRNGYALRQSQPYDFVGNHRMKLPYCNRCQTGGDELESGYFGVPGYAAGVASRVLQAARAALGHEGGIVPTPEGPALAVGPGLTLTNWRLRRALEVAAHVPGMAEYDPTFGGTNPSLFEPLRPVGPVLDAAPWVAVGWGLLSPDPAKGVVERALGVLGFGAAPPDKPQGFCEYMSTYMEARFTYWDAFPSAQPGRGQINGRDLYIGCESALP